MSKDVLGLKGSQAPALAHSANLVKAQPTVPASGVSGASLASADHLQPITNVVKQGAGGVVGNYVLAMSQWLGVGRDYGRLDYLSMLLEHLQFSIFWLLIVAVYI